MSFLRTVAGLKAPALLDLYRFAVAITCVTGCFGLRPVWAAQATTTTLSLTSGGNVVSSVAGGTVVTMTATVEAGATTLTLGQVNFCDASAASCTDIHLIGAAQLTSAGSAVLCFRPGPGNHSYKAVFLGTVAGAPSSSAAAGLTVSPRPPRLQTTFTVAAVTGPDATNEYALTASVGTKGAIPPGGMVSFLNMNNQNSPLGTATLKPVSGGTGFLNLPIPQPAGAGADALPLIAIGDFNGDGIADIVSAPHGGISISLGQGDGTFAAPLIPNAENHHRARSADDRDPDRHGHRVRRQCRSPASRPGQSRRTSGRIYRHGHGYQWSDHSHHRHYRDRELRMGIRGVVIKAAAAAICASCFWERYHFRLKFLSPLSGKPSFPQIVPLAQTDGRSNLPSWNIE